MSLREHDDGGKAGLLRQETTHAPTSISGAVSRASAGFLFPVGTMPVVSAQDAWLYNLQSVLSLILNYTALAMILSASMSLEVCFTSLSVAKMMAGSPLGLF